MAGKKKKNKRAIEMTPEQYNMYLRGRSAQEYGTGNSGPALGLQTNFADARVPFPRYTKFAPITDASDRSFISRSIGTGYGGMTEHERFRLLRRAIKDGMPSDYHLRRYEY